MLYANEDAFNSKIQELQIEMNTINTYADRHMRKV